MPRYGNVDTTYALHLATCPPEQDGPIYMLNLMKYRDRADYGPAGGPDISGEEADNRYAPLAVLAELGARVCFFGTVVGGSEDWDRVAVVRYPTRRTFIDMQARTDFQDKHVHKEAGMLRTTILGTLPTGDLPTAAAPGQVQFELRPLPGVADEGAILAVEGAIVGDGREWADVSVRALVDDAAPEAAAGVMRLVVQPALEAWYA